MPWYAVWNTGHNGWHRLVEEWEVVIFDVHEFELCVATLLRDFVDPFGHGLAVATVVCFR